jgi:hypothetical protein
MASHKHLTSETLSLLAGISFALTACTTEGDTTTVVAACGPGTNLVGQTCVLADGAAGSGPETGGSATGGSSGGGNSGGSSHDGGAPSTGGGIGVGGSANTGGTDSGGTSSGGVSTGGTDTGGTSTGGTSTGGTSSGARWLVYTADQSYAVDLTKYPLQAPHQLSFGAGTWSPDGRYLAQCDQGCSIHDMSGEVPGPARVIGGTGCGSGTTPVAWAPDGRSVVNFTASVAAVDPAEALPIRHLIDNCGLNVGFSPVHNVLAYAASGYIKVVAVNDGVAGPVTTLGTYEYPSSGETNGSWSAVGDKLAWVDADGALQVASLGSGITGTVTKVTNAVDIWAWSPDGASIAYAVYDSANSRDRLYVAALDGAAPTSVEVPSTATYFDLSWSPDSRYVLWSGGTEVLLDTQSATPALEPLGEMTNIVWNPNSQMFAAQVSGSVIVIDPEFPETQHLIAASQSNVTPRYAFSPDGTALAVGHMTHWVLDVTTLPPSPLVSTLATSYYGSLAIQWSDSGSYLGFMPRQSTSNAWQLGFAAAEGPSISAPVNIVSYSSTNGYANGILFQPGL